VRIRETQAINTSATIDSEIIFTSGSQGSTLMGCYFLFTDLTISVSDISLIRNHLYQVEFTGTSNNIVIMQNYVYAHINAGSGDITNTNISNNIIKGQIYAQGTSGPLIVSNNVFWTTNWNFPIDCHNAIIQNNIVCYESSTIRQNTGNTISNNILAEDGTDANGNQYNVDMNLVFADFDGSLELSTDGKWELKAGSPALGAGSGGVDCGAFGDPLPMCYPACPTCPIFMRLMSRHLPPPNPDFRLLSRQRAENNPCKTIKDEKGNNLMHGVICSAAFICPGY
jgi:hypothetical protein